MFSTFSIRIESSVLGGRYSDEHCEEIQRAHLVREGEGPAIRCRTMRRTPRAHRWSAEKVSKIETSPRKPCLDSPQKDTVEAQTGPARRMSYQRR